MVSSRIDAAFARGVPRHAVSLVFLLLFLCAWLGFAGCSKTECLQADCQTSLPTAAAGAAGSAGAASSGAAGASAATSSGKPCTTNATCLTSKGEFCVAGKCELSCLSHYDCQGFGVCESGVDADGAALHYCSLGKKQKPGQFYTHCPADTDCDAANGFFCVGAGADDLDAYCTSDCQDDSTCPAGLACTPLTRSPCEANCGLAGDPKDRQCIKTDQIGAGKAWQCGSRGVTRNACRPRKFCSACESDADCLAVPNQICAKDMSGAKTCTQLCDVTHPSCPWGNAARCDVWDQDLGLATCAHKFGQCTGTGKGCEPCLKDADCGARGVCTASSFTGERWCVDFSVNCSCAASADTSGVCTGGGCPKSPGGLDMSCIDTTPKMPNSGVCAGANTSSVLLSSPQTGCWPAN